MYKYFPLLLILSLAAFLRFYRLPEMANYDFDQEYAANFAYSVLKEYPIQLIGQGLSVPGLFMGPLYFYYLVPFFALFNLHPLGGYVGSVVLGLAIIITYFIVASYLFGTKTGLVAAFLRSFLASKIEADWTMVPAFSSELLVLITWYCFYKYWQGQTKTLPLLGFTFGLFTSFHPILFPFYFIFLILFFIKRKLPCLKIVAASLISFAIPLLPLLIFEYLHSFLEVKQLFSLNKTSTETRNLGRMIDHLQTNFDGLFTILGINPSSLTSILMILFAVLIFFLIAKKIGFWKESFHQVMLLITYLVFLVYYTLFPTHVPEYYFLALSTLSLLYIGGLLGLLADKKSTLPFLVIALVSLLLSNVYILKGKWQNPSLVTLYHKDQIVKEILKNQSKGEEFFVSYINLPGWNFGFNYLFKLYGQVPQTLEARPPVYSIVIPSELSLGNLNFKSGNIGLILPK